ncbi:MAG: hypothetical protein NTU53_15250 [Planctomycetota bacterium]|nr:hypothetical protein [Planctomycetota bacterium]
MATVQCQECKTVLDEHSTCTPEQRMPCPKCGSLSRSYHVSIDDTVGLRDGLGLQARHADGKRPFLESYGGADYSKKLGKHVEKQRVVDRDNDEYLEHIVDYETGAVLHHCEEPLSAHTGHGSDNPKKRSGAG